MVPWIAHHILRFAYVESTASPLASPRPGTHQWTLWEGPAIDEAEALQCAEQADPRVDLEWMRIRHEMDLDIR